MNATDLKSKSKKELIEMAKTKEGYDPSVHKDIRSLKLFLLGGSKKMTKKDLLLERAMKFGDFRKTVHGKTVATLEAFLKTKEGSASASSVVVAPVVSGDTKKKTKKQVLLDEASKYPDFNLKTHGKTIASLETFLKSKSGAAAASPPSTGGGEEIEVWPVPPQILKEKYSSVEKMKKLLQMFGIKEGIPRSKKEIEELFRKSRCSPTNFTCSEEEFCDLRNEICRELSLIKKDGKDNFARGMDYFYQDGRFYGTKEVISKIREAFHKKAEQPSVAPSKSPVIQGGVVETKMSGTPPPAVPSPPVPVQQLSIGSIQTSVPDSKDSGISPININSLLEKPSSEIEIRKAILNCLGLYNEIGPNDELLS